MRFKKAVIIGMGLMGGSLGLALRKYKLAKEVVGLGRNIKRLNMAKAAGAADSVTVDVKDAVTGADLVVISLPVMMIPVMFKQIQPFLSKASIVTDMGSVKGSICSKISKFDTGRNFIGSHPMVGSEKAGVENIKNGLYENGTCIITADKGSDKKKAAAVSGLWKSLKMNIISMTPEAHDKCMAGISHVPHLAAFAMVSAQEKELLGNKKAIGPGFKDSTRIAGSNEEIWAEILLMNKKEVLENMKKYRAQLDLLASMIDGSRMAELKKYIAKARRLRDGIK